MNGTTKDTVLQDAKEIECIAFLLRSAAEQKNLYDTGDETLVETAAQMIQSRSQRIQILINALDK